MIVVPLLGYGGKNFEGTDFTEAFFFYLSNRAVESKLYTNAASSILPTSSY